MSSDKSAIARREDGPAVQITPMAMLEMASSKDIDPDKLQKLMDFAERWQANQARAAFNEAMGLFKASPPRINKNKHVKFGTTEYDHATLDHVTDEITAALSKVGIRHRWETAQRDGKIIVTCVLSHQMGHSESTPLEASADTSGSKNPIQAIASAVTYLQRYTLLAATGMAAAGTDNDGAGAPPAMAESQYVAHLENIQQANTLEDLKNCFKAAYTAAEDAKDKSARDEFMKAKENKKRELSR